MKWEFLNLSQRNIRLLNYTSVDGLKSDEDIRKEFDGNLKEGDYDY